MSRRYAITLELKYQLRTGAAGSGVTANVSSGGAFFRCGEVLPIGQLIQLDLAWPFLYNQRQPLRLRLYGMTLRSGADGTAMSISKHEYRLAGA
jgi:hypothetical protein